MTPSSEPPPGRIEEKLAEMVSDPAVQQTQSRSRDEAGRTHPDAPVRNDAGDLLAAVPEVEVDLENGGDAKLEKTPSKSVQRGKRRGLFAYLVIGIPEIEDPVQYSRQKKNFIVFIIALAATAAPMG
jgi:hypothetical protein